PNGSATRKTSFFRVSAWHYDFMSPPGGAHGGEQQTSYRLELSTEPKLTVIFRLAAGRARDLAGSQQDTQRDRQIEPAAFFRKIGRREIYSDVARGEFEVGVGKGGADALFALLHHGR